MNGPCIRCMVINSTSDVGRYPVHKSHAKTSAGQRVLVTFLICKVKIVEEKSSRWRLSCFR